LNRAFVDAVADEPIQVMSDVHGPLGENPEQAEAVPHGVRVAGREGKLRKDTRSAPGP